MVPWPCDTCGAAGVKNLGTRGYCAAHLAELYKQFDPAVFQLNGVGMQAGPARPDWGPEFFDLECCACGAGWTGTIGEPCWWCEHAHQIMVEHSARLVLQAPDLDTRHPSYAKAMEAWAERLARAVAAGLVDRESARRAWRRECGETAA